MKVATGQGRWPLGMRAIAGIGTFSLLAAGLVLTNTTPAWAKDYPSWDDVSTARASESATVTAIADIEALLAGLESEMVAAQADADDKGNRWIAADLEFQEGVHKTQRLQEQATAANASAEASRLEVGRIAAQLSRGASSSTASILLSDSGTADDLLYRLGMSDKLAEQANGIYEDATQDRNTAQSLTDQADVAEVILEEMKVTAEEAFVEAEAAATLAQTKLQEQSENEARLRQQLTVLSERRAAVETDYQAGVAAEQAAAAARAAAAASAAAAARAAAAATAPAGAPAGVAAASGWASPVSGRITSPFGYRVHPISKTRKLHTGTDVGAGCGQNQYSASSGTVTYAGWNGGYGNFILVDNGNGISTAYAHIIDGGLLVSKGQSVSAGQNIARVGTTGSSTGCHAHFEVRQNGVAIDPAPFLRARGASIG